MAEMIADRIYGTQELDPVSVDINNSQTHQRLSRIRQYGGPTEWGFFKSFPRIDHANGTMMLTKSLGGPRLECIAAQIHDENHAPFSHLWDYVVHRNDRAKARKEDHQDQNFAAFIMSSEIPEILSDHGLNVADILDLKKFPILERPGPALCADRVDYCLRELPTDRAQQLLKKVVVLDNQIVFDDAEAALEFAEDYLKLQTGIFENPEQNIRYSYLEQAISEAMETGEIFEDDAKTDDYHIIEKLLSSNIKNVAALIDALKNPELPNTDKGIYWRTFGKFRWVNPTVVTENGLVKVTDLNPDFEVKVKIAHKNHQKGLIIPKVV